MERLSPTCLSHSDAAATSPPHTLCPCVIEWEQQRGYLIYRRSEVAWVVFGFAKLRDDPER